MKKAKNPVNKRYGPYKADYRKAAKALFEEEGVLEIDENAEISFSTFGAYVQAWVFVNKEDAEKVKYHPPKKPGKYVL